MLASIATGTPLGAGAGAGFASPIPRGDVEVVAPRHLRTRSPSLMKRDANASFDLGFQLQNQVLFDG